MSDSVTCSSSVFAPGHLGELTAVVPPEMVDAALESAGGKEQRRRRLPSRVVVYLLLAGGLFADQGWRQVWDRLTGGLGGPVPGPSRSSITGAMRRVGAGPLRELFTLLAGPGVVGADSTVRFAGRLVVAIDGTQIPVADTQANRVAFPKPPGGPNGEPGYPFLRMVAIIACGTRSLLEASFGTDQTGELAYARRLMGCLRPGMLLLGDRNFATYQLFTDITDTGADFLLRAKTGSTAMNLPVRQRLSDGSFLTSARGRTIRVIDAVITLTTHAQTHTSPYRLITTLLDPAQAPALDLVRLYHQRWEIETSYCELKSTILGGRVLRGRYPGAVTQELWAILTVYQALRIAIADTALARPGTDPNRLSFTIALNTARDQIIRAAHTLTDTTVDLLGRIGAALLAALLPARRTRTRLRVTKRAISKHRAKGRNVDRRTYPATLRTAILTTNPTT